MDLATAQTNLDAALTAVNNGGMTVSYADKTVRYASMDDILKAVTFWQRAVEGYTAAASGATHPQIKIAQWT